TMPTRSIPADCARAASGQAATPPRRVMNSRRLILAQGVALREFYLVLGLVTRKFGLNNGSDGMSALGQKQTFALHQPMSALPPKADICSANRNVRFGPILLQKDF